METSRLQVRARPGALPLTMATAVMTLVLATGFTGASAASWSQRRIADDPPAAMTVDDRGHIHVVVGSGGGLRYLTNATGAWASTRITSFGGQPAIALSAGKAYVVFARIGDCGADEDGCRTDPNQGLYLATNRSGVWATQRLPGTRPAYWPSLRMRGGRLHIAYNDLRGIRYLTNRSGTWANHRVWSATGARLTSAARTSIALDADGPPYIAFMRTRCAGASDFGFCPVRETVLRGVSLVTRLDGRWMANGASDGSDMLDRVVIDPAGKPLVGYTHRLASGVLQFRVTRFDEMDALSSRTLPGRGMGSFTLDRYGRIELLRWAHDRLTWRAERTSGWVSRSWPTPRIKVAWVRLVDGASTIIRDGFDASVRAYSTWALRHRSAAVPAAPTTRWGPMAVVEARAEDLADTGVRGGRLAISARCVTIRAASASSRVRSTLVFREGQVIWDAGHRRIRFHNKVGGWVWLQDGDLVRSMGGWDPWRDTDPSPGVPAWVVRPNTECPGDRTLVHEVTKA